MSLVPPNEWYVELMRGATTCACSALAAASILFGNLQYSTNTLLPALVAAAVNLRSVGRAALVLGSFILCLFGSYAVQYQSRVSEQKHQVDMVKELGASNKFKTVCQATGGFGTLSVTVGGVTFKVDCQLGAPRAPSEHEHAYTGSCHGVSFSQIDENNNQAISLPEAQTAMTRSVPRIIERVGLKHGCVMNVGKMRSTDCFYRHAGEGSLVQRGEEFESWLRCELKTSGLSSRCIDALCTASHDEL